MKKLLIVDDSTDQLYAMQKLLTYYNYTIEAAKDSKALMKELETFKPDIVLLDVILGGEDGRDICMKIRENQAYQNMTIILFSASPKLLDHFKEYGADGAIEKPFGINDLINQINFAIHNRKEVLRK